MREPYGAVRGAIIGLALSIPLWALIFWIFIQ